MNVGFEDLVGFLFEREELLRGKEGGIWARWEVRVTPWRAIRVTITIVLVLQEILTGRSVHLNLYNQMHTYDIIIQLVVEKARSSERHYRNQRYNLSGCAVHLISVILCLSKSSLGSTYRAASRPSQTIAA